MTIVEMQNEKKSLKDEMKKIVTSAEVEKRALSDDEKTKVAEYATKIEEIDAKIAEREKELRGKEQEARSKKQESKRFSLMRMLNSAVDNRAFDEDDEAVIEAGKKEMRASGQSFSGRIVLPMEYRASIQATVATAGIENVPEDKLNILEPLRNRLVMVQAGATYMTGLVGDVSIPVYSGSNVAWAGEVAAAADGAGTFSEVTLQPKRLTAYLNISKQFLIQDSNSAESMLRADIVRALQEKLESTLLGNAAGTATQPAGIGTSNPSPTTIAAWADIVGLEEALELANVYGDYVYVMSPSAKATLRTMSKDTGSGLFVLDSGGINGYRALSTNGVFANGIVVGNWADYVIGQWGGIDLTVDPYTQAGNGMVRIVINAYFDGKPRRNASFQIATV